MPFYHTLLNDSDDSPLLKDLAVYRVIAENCKEDLDRMIKWIKAMRKDECNSELLLDAIERDLSYVLEKIHKTEGRLNK